MKAVRIVLLVATLLAYGALTYAWGRLDERGRCGVCVQRAGAVEV